MVESNLPRYAIVAAKWWRDKVASDEMTKFSNGCESYSGFLSMVLASRLSESSPVDDETLDRFEKILARKISECVNAEKILYIRCDYDSDEFLTTVAAEAGISRKRYPWKTTMRVSNETVEVACGYGKPFQIIYRLEGSA